MHARFSLLGIDDEVTTCECCGKTNLKCTVVLSILDADGAGRGEVRYGRDCGARALGLKKTSADKMESKARVAEFERLWAARAGGSKRTKVIDGRFPSYATIYPLTDGRDLLLVDSHAPMPAGQWRQIMAEKYVGKAA